MKKTIFVILIVILVMYTTMSLKASLENKNLEMIDFSIYSKDLFKEKSVELNITIEIVYVVNNLLEENTFISQSIKKGVQYKEGDKLVITLSKKELTLADYELYKVNELGVVPIMMYHGIYNLKNDDTAYTGGNVDKDGYNRTTEAFTNDLETYYQSGFRMIRLIDYVNGEIDVELGKSPIVLTFDDGKKNNINILGKDEKGNLMIDPNSAIGILESFKDKYPDFNVTATFFINESLFEQPTYNEEIIKWLISNGYDVGNHTLGHVDFANIDSSQTQKSIAYIYQKLDEIVLGKYVPIIALPYGSPYTTNHPNFQYIINGEYDNYKYETKATLMVGWEPNYSPFHKNFNSLLIKRVRAYDNNGINFDISMVLKILESKKYISDGDVDKVTVKDDTNIKSGINKKITKY